MYALLYFLNTTIIVVLFRNTNTTRMYFICEFQLDLSPVLILIICIVLVPKANRTRPPKWTSSIQSGRATFSKPRSLPLEIWHCGLYFRRKHTSLLCVARLALSHRRRPPPEHAHPGPSSKHHTCASHRIISTIERERPRGKRHARTRRT